MEVGAYAIMFGIDPHSIVNQGDGDYIINLALLKKAIELQAKQKVDEIEILSKLIGHEVLQGLARIF